MFIAWDCSVSLTLPHITRRHYNLPYRQSTIQIYHKSRTSFESHTLSITISTTRTMVEWFVGRRVAQEICRAHCVQSDRTSIYATRSTTLDLDVWLMYITSIAALNIFRTTVHTPLPHARSLFRYLDNLFVCAVTTMRRRRIGWEND